MEYEKVSSLRKKQCYYTELKSVSGRKHYVDLVSLTLLKISEVNLQYYFKKLCLRESRRIQGANPT